MLGEFTAGEWSKTFVALGACLGFIAVALGAFGSHALKDRIGPELQHAFEIGIRYQFIHALALLILAWVSAVFPSTWMLAAGWLFFGGSLVFSGSLYALALTANMAVGGLTPLGGLALLAGWLCVFIGAILS